MLLLEGLQGNKCGIYDVEIPGCILFYLTLVRLNLWKYPILSESVKSSVDAAWV